MGLLGNLVAGVLSFLGSSSGGVSAKISQAWGSYPKWNIAGLAPSSTFTVYAYANRHLKDVYEYTAGADGTDSRDFDAGHATPGSLIYIQVSQSGGSATSNRMILRPMP